jgi:hypothetical protein
MMASIDAATRLENVDTMDTKGLSTDGIHYKAAGMVVIGRRSAHRWFKTGPGGSSPAADSSGGRRGVERVLFRPAAEAPR